MKKMKQELLLIDNDDLDIEVFEERLKDIVGLELSKITEDEYVFKCFDTDKSILCDLLFLREPSEKYGDLIYKAIDGVSDCIPQRTVSFILEEIAEVNIIAVLSYTEKTSNDDQKAMTLFKIVDLFTDLIYCPLFIDEENNFLNNEFIRVLFKKLPHFNRLYTAMLNEENDYENFSLNLNNEQERKNFINYK